MIIMGHKDLEGAKRFRELKMGEANMIYFSENYSELKARFPREYVAIKDGDLLDHDKDPEAMMRRIHQTFDPKSGESLSIGIWYIPAIGEHGAPG
ncbi:MAG TPA: hypothetical protein VJH90_04300 [archaeon]|nr:hypothetical protein [archaeon]